MIWNMKQRPKESFSCMNELLLRNRDTLPHVEIWKKTSLYFLKQHYRLIQVNLCQRQLFLHQLTHNMTKDCSLNYEFSTSKLQAQYMLCTKIVLAVKTKQNCLHNMYWTCSFLVCIALIIQWTISCHILRVSWCKNKCFWKRFICN